LSAPVLFQIANDLTKMQINASVAEADVGSVVQDQWWSLRGRVSVPQISRQGDAGAQFTHHGAERGDYDTIIEVEQRRSETQAGMTRMFPSSRRGARAC